MIQSSQPSSLKLTCSAFLLHLDFVFFPCLFPWRLFKAVLRLRRAFNWRPLSSSSSSLPEPRDLIFSFISLKRFSLFLDLAPSCRRSTSVSDRPRVTLRWKQSGAGFPVAERGWSLNMSHTSITSHPGFLESSGSSDLECRGLSERHGYSWRLYGPVAGTWTSLDAFLNILNSAPTSSSLSETLKSMVEYVSILVGTSPSQKNSTTRHPHSTINALLLYIPQGPLNVSSR
uniref:Uncharacterized protein n=1 Tax=Gadus morhua TaxID=8049 RepID=A0A8C5CYS7_GADMO